MKDQLIRDRLVVGIRDSALSGCLQLEADLTPDKAKKHIHQREAVRMQQDVVHIRDVTSLDTVRQSTTVRRKLSAIPQKPPQNNRRRCGGGTHPRHLCPAKEATCYRYIQQTWPLQFTVPVQHSSNHINCPPTTPSGNRDQVPRYC